MKKHIENTFKRKEPAPQGTRKHGKANSQVIPEGGISGRSLNSDRTLTGSRTDKKRKM